MTDTILKSGDRPAIKLDEKVKVTPAMIEAGVMVLHESGAVENPLSGADEIVIERIYRAMHRKSEEQVCL